MLKEAGGGHSFSSAGPVLLNPSLWLTVLHTVHVARTHKHTCWRGHYTCICLPPPEAVSLHPSSRGSGVNMDEAGARLCHAYQCLLNKLWTRYRNQEAGCISCHAAKILLQTKKKKQQLNKWFWKGSVSGAVLWISLNPMLMFRSAFFSLILVLFWIYIPPVSGDPLLNMLRYCPIIKKKRSTFGTLLDSIQITDLF